MVGLQLFSWPSIATRQMVNVWRFRKSWGNPSYHMTFPSDPKLVNLFSDLGLYWARWKNEFRGQQITHRSKILIFGIQLLKLNSIDQQIEPNQVFFLPQPGVWLLDDAPALWCLGCNGGHSIPLRGWGLVISGIWKACPMAIWHWQIPTFHRSTNVSIIYELAAFFHANRGSGWPRICQWFSQNWREKVPIPTLCGKPANPIILYDSPEGKLACFWTLGFTLNG